jgi:hypothetical protein
LIPFSIALCY